MWKEEDIRVFFVSYDNGECYYFKLYPTGELFCPEFNKMRKNTEGKNFSMAHTLEFVGDNFNLKDDKGEIIYSLLQYRQANNLGQMPKIEHFYIDEDIRPTLIEQGKITFDKTVENIPGFLFGSFEEPKVRRR